MIVILVRGLACFKGYGIQFYLQTLNTHSRQKQPVKEQYTAGSFCQHRVLPGIEELENLNVKALWVFFDRHLAITQLATICTCRIELDTWACTISR